MLQFRTPAIKPVERAADFINTVRKYYQPARLEDILELRKSQKETNVVVLNRNKEVYVSKDTEDEQLAKAENKKENKKRGHFCVAHQPYQSLGKVVLDSEELFLDVVHDCLNDEFYQHYASIAESKNKYIPMDGANNAVKQTSGALPESVTVMKYFEANYDHGCAGMDEIKCLLKETKSRIIACQAGQSYLHHVRQYQASRKLAAEKVARELLAGNMVVKKLSRDMIDAALLTEPSVVLSGQKSKSFASSKSSNVSHQSSTIGPSSSSVLQKLRKSPKNDEIKSAKDVPEDMGDEDKLYPLTKLQLKSLRLDPFRLQVEKVMPERTTSTGSIMQKANIFSTPCTTSITNIQRDATIGTQLSPPDVIGTHLSEFDITCDPLQSQPTAFYRSEAVTQLGFKSRRRMTRAVPVHDAGFQSVGMFEPKPVWEDLLNAGNKNKHQHVPRRIPTWQRPVSPSDKINKKIINGELEINPMLNAVARFQSNFSQTKKKIQKQVVNELDKLERLRIAKSKYKVSLLNKAKKASPMFEIFKFNLQNVPSLITKGLMPLEQRTSPWFKALLDESKGVKCNEHPQVVDWFGKLEPFTQDNISVQPLVKEKLCLLTYSLPIEEICSLHVQDAILFVVENILEAHPDLLCDWMNERHLVAIRQRARPKNIINQAKF